MRYYYVKAIPRIMHDYDIAVPRDRFLETMELLRDDSVKDKGVTTWSDTVIGHCSGNDIEMDVHQWIFKEKGDIDSGIWERAVPVQIQGVDLLVPSLEDMFVHQLNTQARNYFTLELPENRMKWLFDFGTIVRWEAGLDEERLIKAANQFSAQYPVRLMLRLYSICLQEEIFTRLAERIQPVTEEYRSWLMAGLAVQREEERFLSYGYEADGPLNFIKVLRLLRRSYKEYRFLCSLPLGREKWKSFPNYWLEQRSIKNWSDFKNKYFHRIDLFGVNDQKRRGNRR